MKVHKINQVMQLLEAFRELHPKITLEMVLTFLEVAKDNGVNGRDIETLLDTNSTTAARFLRLFDRKQSSGEPGLNLIEARIDPDEYRSKLRYLNDDGRAFMDKLDSILK